MNQTTHAGPGQPPVPALHNQAPASPYAPLRNPLTVAPGSAVPQYLLIPALVGLHPGVETEGAFRNRIQKYETAKRNNLATPTQLEFLECVHRPEGTRRIVINYPRYLRWLSCGQEGASA